MRLDKTHQRPPSVPSFTTALLEPNDDMEKNCSKKKEEKKEVVDKELISLREELMENLQKVAAIQKEISEKKYLFGE